ncbi:MAG: hypothetical protein ABIA74_01990 [bacterium]
MENQKVFYDIYDFYYIPFWKTIEFKLIVSIVLLCLFFALALIFYLRRKRKKQSSWQWAICELNKLSVDKLNSKKDFKLFYFDLTFIIKKYFQKRFDWNTRDKTDEEFIYLLTDRNFDAELLKDLKKMLQGASWIKFANEEVLKTQSNKDLELAKKIIEKTIPVNS